MTVYFDSRSNKTSNSSVIMELRRLFVWDGSNGRLEDLRERCRTLMKEVETITKEVGGDVEKSQRYLEAREILHQIQALENIASGRHIYTPSRPPAVAEG